MLGFDHELRRRGFAGNSCQILMELGAALPAAVLQQRLDELHGRFPLRGARLRGFLRPGWIPNVAGSPTPTVRIHQAAPVLADRLLNEPLESRSGELLRFDLIEHTDGRSTVVFTWNHALMDAPGAEYFLALIGRDDLPWADARPATPSAETPARLADRLRLAWKSLHHLDKFCRAAPRSPGVRFPEAPARLRYRVETFSADETARVRANATRLCGVLGAAQFHAATALVGLHRLQQRLGCASPSYVLPVPVGLRPKGGIEPVFSNQVGMLMLQLLPGQLESPAQAAAELKKQTADAMRSGLLESGRALCELFQFLPLPIYMAMVKQGLRGEICSLFYGDSGHVSPALTKFLGAPIRDFTHVAAVTPSPGVGVVFFSFGGTLRVTVLHLETVLNEVEAAGYAAGLRASLLDP
jgi:hypothetical protein